ncbi:RagB/SusD family nutrient uptake outer membrane protein [Flavivirga aquimarina]|uniref:RagB/SusD family nutrient uptake outer membrane protein n=1 Tax=Flavivirga aquimarina TaxID=2027862 RepID=A0ABT8W6H8_9FLAO|nr:RagB/SusD family nutrient uptake outer membrane protein [Flavivirga aquimarina]MDO5968718.1 RagB/SusD family nutrient uptake outer membrane protein [Flavivirga aquimarina]
MKLTNKVLTIIILVLCLSGCSSFFDEELQYTHEEEVLDSGRKSRALIDDIYRDYSFRYFTDFGIEYLTDNSVLNSSETNLATGYWGPTSNPLSYVWQQSYNNIRVVYQYIDLVHNTGLPYLPSEGSADLSDAIVQRYYGEAHFLKAWAEWELLKVFGGPDESGNMLGFPIVDGILENDAYATLSRNTFDECVDQIMADLDVAIDNLPLIYTGTEDTDAGTNLGTAAAETGRASGLAAYALKAKLALFAASPAFNPTNDLTKWELAANLAHEVIELNGGLRSLQAYDFDRENNPDHIWRMRNSRNDNSLENRLYPPTLYGQGEVNPSQNLIDAFPDANGYPINNASSSYDANEPYTSRDARFYKFFFYNGDQCFTSATCNNYDPIETFQGGLDNFGGFIPNEGTRTGYYLKKFLNNLNFNPSEENRVTTLPKVYVQLGLTDIYLSYAEALNEVSGPDATPPTGFNFSAKDVLARVRQRASLFSDPYLDEASMNQSDFRNLVKNERRIELCFTGERFHDLRRWKDITNIENLNGVKITKNPDDSFSYNNIEVERRNYETKNYYLPLPYDELQLNKNLKQNQGW